MKYGKMSALVIGTALAVLLAGCGSPSRPAAKAAPSPSAANLRPPDASLALTAADMGAGWDAPADNSSEQGGTAAQDDCLFGKDIMAKTVGDPADSPGFTTAGRWLKSKAIVFKDSGAAQFADAYASNFEKCFGVDVRPALDNIAARNDTTVGGVSFFGRDATVSGHPVRYNYARAAFASGQTLVVAKVTLHGQHTAELISATEYAEPGQQPSDITDLLSKLAAKVAAFEAVKS